MRKIKTLPLPVEPAQEPEESWRVIEVPIWKGHLFIHVGSDESFRVRLGEAGYDPDRIDDFEKSDEVQAITVRDESKCIIHAKRPLEPPVLVHELLHAALSIMRARHCEDEEALCYTLEYLYKEATK